MSRAAPTAVLLALAVLLAGCSDGRDGAGGDGGTGPPDCDEEPGPTGTGDESPGPVGAMHAATVGADLALQPQEPDGAVLHVAFQSDCGATVEVPFPHLDSCRAPDHWMAGTVSGGAEATVRNATDGRSGRVLALTGTGSVSWSSQIEPGPPCQTFRHDPWSTDPDPADGTAEARVAEGEASYASVLVRLVRGGCGNATLHDGVPGPEWTSLPGRSVPVASCA